MLQDLLRGQDILEWINSQPVNIKNQNIPYMIFYSFPPSFHLFSHRGLVQETLEMTEHGDIVWGVIASYPSNLYKIYSGSQNVIVLVSLCDETQGAEQFYTVPDPGLLRHVLSSFSRSQEAPNAPPKDPQTPSRSSAPWRQSMHWHYLLATRRTSCLQAMFCYSKARLWWIIPGEGLYVNVRWVAFSDLLGLHWIDLWSLREWPFASGLWRLHLIKKPHQSSPWILCARKLGWASIINHQRPSDCLWRKGMVRRTWSVAIRYSMVTCRNSASVYGTTPRLWLALPEMWVKLTLHLLCCLWCCGTPPCHYDSKLFFVHQLLHFPWSLSVSWLKMKLWRYLPCEMAPTGWDSINKSFFGTLGTVHNVTWQSATDV